MITVWKKALKVISVKDWTWENVILELECDETKLLEFTGSGSKCRVPEVKVVRIISYETDTFSAADTAADAADRSAALSPHVTWDSTKTWQHNYGSCNFTNLSDGDVVSWYDHTRWHVGETVKCDRWEGIEYGQCARGIHVFKTRELAEQYKF